jgi:hypothetical protein
LPQQLLRLAFLLICKCAALRSRKILLVYKE